jgi:hypothetical protein
MYSASRYLYDVKFGLLSAIELSTNEYRRWKHDKTTPINWQQKDINGLPDNNAGSILNDFFVVEKFYLDKQLFVGKRGGWHSFRPERGISNRSIEVRYKLAKRSIAKRSIKVEFKVAVAYFEEHNVMQILLFTTFPKIRLDDLIFIKQAKWYQVETSGWKLLVNLSGPSPDNLSSLCAKVLNSFGLADVEDKGHPFFDFIEVSNLSPSENPSENKSFKADHRLTTNEHYGLLTGDEGYRLIGDNNESVKNALSNETMSFGSRDYFFYHFTSTSCVCFFSKDRSKIRNEWSRWYRDNVGFIPSLYDYTNFSSPLPCIADGVILLIERCLLRYIELSRVYEYLSDAKRFVAVMRVFKKLIGAETDRKLLSRLDKLDLIVDSSLWLIAVGYEKYLFGYKNLQDRVVSAIERRSRFTSERVSIIIGFSAIIIGLLSLITSIISVYRVFLKNG